MERGIFLDTHAVVWLYQKNLDLFKKETLILMEKNKLYISPLVTLELEYLFEINKINKKSQTIIKTLKKEIDLIESNINLNEIAKKATKIKWTRDPFDRLITATATINKNNFITKDKKILNNYSKAIW